MIKCFDGRWDFILTYCHFYENKHFAMLKINFCRNLVNEGSLHIYTRFFIPSLFPYQDSHKEN